MHARYVQYRAGSERLADLGNWCLTLLEHTGGSRHKAARLYGISLPVLNTLGNLTAERGGQEARKAKGVAVPFSPKEREWLDRAIRVIIKRAGEVARDPTTAKQQITMADLPSL